MLENVSKDLLLGLIIGVLGVSAVAVVVGIVLIIKSVLNAKKNGDNRWKYILASVLCVIVGAASWILNFGWIRFIMTVVTAPFIHSIAFFFINVFSASYTNKSQELKTLAVISCVSYLMGYIFLPDSGDTGPMYAMFTLVRGDAVTNMLFEISVLAFIINIICLIMQVIKTVAARKQCKAENNETASE